MTLIQPITPPQCGCDAPEALAGLITLEAALARISRSARPIVGTEVVPLFPANGRVLAEDVCAISAAPPFDNAAMDGYAVQSASLSGSGPWILATAGRIPAGEAPPAPVGPGRAARIFTGAPVPEGADAVIRQEDVVRRGDLISFEKRPEPGLNVRRAGGDMVAGQVIVRAGTLLSPRSIGACAAAGASKVTVRRTLRVALLVTGNEVCAPGQPRAGAEIWDVNTPLLAALMGGPLVALAHVKQIPDCQKALERSLAQVIENVDLVVTTGGVSVGEEDHVKPAVEALGGRLNFSGVAIKPGKPVSYGRLGQCHWLGLPGNPLAALATWHVFGRQLVRELTGQHAPRAPRRHVVLGKSIARKAGRSELRPATVTGFDDQFREVVGFEDATHSARMSGLPAADGLILLPADRAYLPAGATAEFLPFCET